MQAAEKARRLRELFEQLDDAVVECRKLAGGEVLHEDWSWVSDLRDCLFGRIDPSMLRTIKRLEAEAEAERQAA